MEGQFQGSMKTAFHLAGTNYFQNIEISAFGRDSFRGIFLRQSSIALFIAKRIQVVQ